MTTRIALISEHASPLAILGGVDSGGQNVYVAETARHLAARGYLVDVFTRKDHPDQPEVVDWLPGVRVIHVPAGPTAFVRKEDILQWAPDFSAFVQTFAARERYDVVHAHFFMSGLVAMELKSALGLPFVVRTVQPVLESFDAEIEESASSLGATRWQTFRHVLFPPLVPALITGFSLAFARSLGEYGSVIFVSGNIPFYTEIAPKLIVEQLEQYAYAEATAIAVVLLTASFLVLGLINIVERRRAQYDG